jgi:hypothetical protein
MGLSREAVSLSRSAGTEPKVEPGHMTRQPHPAAPKSLRESSVQLTLFGHMRLGHMTRE